LFQRQKRVNLPITFVFCMVLLYGSYDKHRTRKHISGPKLDIMTFTLLLFPKTFFVFSMLYLFPSIPLPFPRSATSHLLNVNKKVGNSALKPRLARLALRNRIMRISSIRRTYLLRVTITISILPMMINNHY